LGTITSDPSTWVTNSQAHTDPVAFTDYLNLTLGEDFLATSTFFEVDPFSLAGLTVSLYEGTYATGDTLGTPIFTAPGSGDVLRVIYQGELTAGSYFFTVSATPVSTIGVYSYTFTTSAVPEPETYAMLLAGLGIVGMVARRRRRV